MVVLVILKLEIATFAICFDFTMINSRFYISRNCTDPRISYLGQGDQFHSDKGQLGYMSSVRISLNQTNQKKLISSPSHQFRCWQVFYFSSGAARMTWFALHGLFQLLT